MDLRGPEEQLQISREESLNCLGLVFLRRAEEFFLNLLIPGKGLHYERLGAAIAWQSGQDEDACQPTKNPMICLSQKSREIKNLLFSLEVIFRHSL